MDLMKEWLVKMAVKVYKQYKSNELDRVKKMILSYKIKNKLK